MRTPSWNFFIIISFFGVLSENWQKGMETKKYLPRKVLVIESNTNLEVLDDPRSFYEKHKGNDFIY